MKITIDEIEVEIKSRDKKDNVVIANILIKEVVEIRGFVVRYGTTKYSPVSPVWFVSPPSVKGRNKAYFWVARIKDSALWEKLEKKIIEKAKEFTNI